jgi:hypothetical protein
MARNPSRLTLSFTPGNRSSVWRVKAAAAGGIESHAQSAAAAALGGRKSRLRPGPGEGEEIEGGEFHGS